MLKLKPLSSEEFDMKFLFKTAYYKFNYFLILNSFILFLKKTFLILLLGLLVSTLSSANTKGQSASQKKPDKLQHSVSNEIKEKEEWRARGVIIKFHLWPNVKQQKEIVKRLKASGLKKTKSIRSFQTQLFEWSEGGLKLSGQGRELVKNLKVYPA